METPVRRALMGCVRTGIRPREAMRPRAGDVLIAAWDGSVPPFHAR